MLGTPFKCLLLLNHRTPKLGKSTLFNRFGWQTTGPWLTNTPGVTFVIGRSGDELRSATFLSNVIDTAALEEANIESLEGRMRARTELLFWKADICLFF